MTIATHPLDDKVWQAWLAENRKHEKAQFARNVRLCVLLMPIAVGATLLIFWLR
jgi:hypothetical protein